jgi:hypothetical protein
MMEKIKTKTKLKFKSYIMNKFEIKTRTANLVSVFILRDYLS